MENSEVCLPHRKPNQRTVIIYIQPMPKIQI